MPSVNLMSIRDERTVAPAHVVTAGPGRPHAQDRPAVAPRVSVVIPALGDPRALGVLLMELALLDLHEVVLVSNGAVDPTVDAARRLMPAVRVVFQVRSGSGNAVAAGLAAASGDVVVTMSADGSCDPAEIPRLVQALLDGAEVATASRFVRGGACADRRLLDTFSRALSWLVCVVLRAPRTDVGHGYRALWADIVPGLRLPDHRVMTPEAGQMLPGDGFEFEALLTGRLAAAGVRTVQVPSAERPSPHRVGLREATTDGLRFVRALVSEWCRTHLRPAPGRDARLPRIGGSRRGPRARRRLRASRRSRRS